MKPLYFIPATLLILLTASCQKDKSKNNPGTTNYAKGKNEFTIMVDGVQRNYIVHVPGKYSGNAAVPMVFMLHGTSGQGIDMWERSGWKEIGEAENIITVYPSSMRYCINHPVDGQISTTKWNSTPAEWKFCANETPRDDIRFLNAVLAEVSNKYKIDNKRVYLVGFSNGGQMAAKCAALMSDKLAAVVSNAAAFYVDSNYNAIRKLPTTFQIGNHDWGSGNADIAPAIPMSQFDTLIRTPNLPVASGRHHVYAAAHVKTFGLNPNFTISGDSNVALVATYRSSTPGSQNDFRYVFVKGLKHDYPNGNRHPMKAAEIHWNWLKQYSIP